MQDQIDIFVSSLNQFWHQVAAFFPKLLAVIIICLLYTSRKCTY